MPRPLLLGHRGLRLPNGPAENSIAAFDRALELGCDGFEFDVRRTNDNHLLVCHDPTYAGLEVATASYAQVSQLPLLEDILARYSRAAFLDIELKVPGLENEAVAALSRHPPQSGFVISSFFPSILRQLHSQSAELPLGFICDREPYFAHWPELPVEYVIPHFSLLKRDSLNALQKAGKKTIVWTVNEVVEMLRFRDWGADGIISDNPALLVQTVA